MTTTTTIIIIRFPSDSLVNDDPDDIERRCYTLHIVVVHITYLMRYNSSFDPPIIADRYATIYIIIRDWNL